MHCLDCGVDCTQTTDRCEACGSPMYTDYDRYFKGGVQAMMEGNMKRSVDCLENCIELNPNHVSGRFNLGMALSLSGRCEEAIQHYALVLDMDPNYPGIFTALGQASFGSYLAHSEEADIHCDAMLTYLMIAIKQDPNDVDAYFSIANAYLAIGNIENALQWLESALKLNPESSAIHYTMARALKLLGQYDEAASAAHNCMELANSDDPFFEEMKQLFEELHKSEVSN